MALGRGQRRAGVGRQQGAARAAQQKPPVDAGRAVLGHVWINPLERLHRGPLAAKSDPPAPSSQQLADAGLRRQDGGRDARAVG